jgi:NTP pyrophosphatase (non-canonical NTP hydrolase)
MEFRDYQTKAMATRSPSTDLVYASGKLTVEAAELQQHVLKTHYHDKVLPIDEVFIEMGDVLWYLAAIATELGISLDEVAEHNLAKLRQRHGHTYNPAHYRQE